MNQIEAIARIRNIVERIDDRRERMETIGDMTYDEYDEITVDDLYVLLDACRDLR